jgi:RNA polymerase sigma factor (sigma-70 family)
LKKDEANIIKGCLKGDKASQYALYNMFRRDVMGICMRYSRDRSEAEDMMQEGFIKVYSDLYQYRPIGPLGGWIRRVVVNSCLRFIRKRKRLVFNEFSGMKTELIPTDENVISDLGAQDLMKLVQLLPDGYRLVFNLYVVEGFSHQEIADQLGISVNTSKSQLSRAKASLRKKIEKILI